MTTFHERLAAAATPGPWKAEDDGGWYVNDEHGRPVADLGYSDRAEAAADAKFMAACPPEMVQAWENVAKAAYDFLSAADNDEDFIAAGDNLEKALAVYDAQVAALQEENDG